MVLTLWVTLSRTIVTTDTDDGDIHIVTAEFEVKEKEFPK